MEKTRGRKEGQWKIELTGLVFGNKTDDYGDGPCPLKEIWLFSTKRLTCWLGKEFPHSSPRVSSRWNEYQGPFQGSTCAFVVLIPAFSATGQASGQ